MIERSVRMLDRKDIMLGSEWESKKNNRTESKSAGPKEHIAKKRVGVRKE
jgi:hypothetical protein